MHFLRIAVVGLVSILGMSTASAQSVRTFVSTTGSDANPCTPEAPCRTFPAAINATSSGGTVIALTSGGYGSDITISKSISIIAPEGIVAQVRSSSNGILVNGSGISVTLQGLYVSGTGAGVKFEAGKKLTVERMTLQSSSFGVYHAAPNATLNVSHTIAENASYCFFANGSPLGQAYLAIDNSRASNCGHGYAAYGNADIAVKRSVAHGTSKVSSDCYANFVTFTNTSYIAADDVLSTRCYFGFLASNAGTEIAVSNALIMDNTIAGSVLNNGIGKSFGNNRLYRNDTNSLTGFTIQGEQ